MDAYRVAHGIGSESNGADATALSRRLERAMQAQLDAVPPPGRTTAHAEPNGAGGFRFWFMWRAT